MNSLTGHVALVVLEGGQVAVQLGVQGGEVVHCQEDAWWWVSKGKRGATEKKTWGRVEKRKKNTMETKHAVRRAAAGCFIGQKDGTGQDGGGKAP